MKLAASTISLCALCSATLCKLILGRVSSSSSYINVKCCFKYQIVGGATISGGGYFVICFTSQSKLLEFHTWVLGT